MTYLVALLIGFLQPDVAIVRDALDASLAILERRAAGLEIPAAVWDSLFSTEGYTRLKERELAFRRPFTDSAFREFLLSDTLAGRLPYLRRAADSRSGLGSIPSSSPQPTASCTGDRTG
jgi:hypothetical protein